MNLNEEELQRSVESGHQGDDPEAKAYQHVFRTLGKDPDFSLPPSFADRMLRIIEARQEKRKFSSEVIWLSVGICSLLIVLVVAVAMTDFKINLGFLSEMSSYTGLFFFGLIFIGILNWVDKRFIKANS